MKQNTQEHIAIYSRKSKFTGKGESIENQIELCRQYIKTHFNDIDTDNILVYEDEGFSGGTLERPQFKRMMQDTHNKKISAIICYRLDRISRNIGDFAKLIEELSELQVAFVSIKEQFDTSSPMGRAMMYIASVFSQLERETIAERIKDNLLELSKTGRWLGGTTPTGYSSESMENINIDGKVKRACKLMLIPEEGKLVQRIYEKFLETTSLTKTETYLIQNGYTSKNNKLFSRFTIKGILSNPVYMKADTFAYEYLTENNVDLFSEKEDFDGVHGIMAYNRTIQKSGKGNQLRPMEEWIVSVGKHEGIINGQDWIKIQGILGQNRSKYYRKPRSNVALLSGLLFCGKCGDYMRPKLSNRMDGDGNNIYSYLCSLKERSRMHSCDMKNVNGNILDKTVIEEIKKLSENGSNFIQQLEKNKKQFLGNQEEYNHSLDQIEQAITENGNVISGLVKTLGKVAGSSSEEYIIKQIEDLHKQNETLSKRKEELLELTATHVLSDIEFDLLKDMLSSFKNTVDSMSVEEKRSAIRTFVKKVVWDGKNVHIYLFGSDGPVELPPESENQLQQPILDSENLEPLRDNTKCYVGAVSLKTQM